jgi:hypothetical protein
MGCTRGSGTWFLNGKGNSVLKNCKLRPFIRPDAIFRVGLRKFFVNGCQRQENPDRR